MYVNQTNAGAYEIVCTTWLASWIDTPPLGLVGSNVA